MAAGKLPPFIHRRNEMDRYIRVTGRSRLSLAPDTTVLNMNISGECSDYRETIKMASEKSASVKAIFTGLGFDPEDVKTGSFNISDRYESYRDESGEYRQRFAGYRFDHQMSVSFSIENELLGRCLASLASCEADPEFHIAYTVKNRDGVRDELLKAALADARERAEVLAAAGGVDLDRLVSVDSSEIGSDLTVRPMSLRMAKMNDAAAEESFAMDITPADVNADCSLVAVWSIR